MCGPKSGCLPTKMYYNCQRYCPPLTSNISDSQHLHTDHILSANVISQSGNLNYSFTKSQLVLMAETRVKYRLLYKRQYCMDVRVLNVLMIFLIRIVGRQHSTIKYKIFNTVPVIAYFCKLSWCRGQTRRGLEIF